MIAFETVFLGMVAHIGCGIVAQLLAEEAQSLGKVGGRTTELIGGKADVAFAVEMALKELAEGDGEPLRELGAESGQGLAIEVDVHTEVYLNGGGVVVFHLSHLVVEMVDMFYMRLLEAVACAGIALYLMFHMTLTLTLTLSFFHGGHGVHGFFQCVQCVLWIISLSSNLSSIN